MQIMTLKTRIRETFWVSVIKICVMFPSIIHYRRIAPSAPQDFLPIKIFFKYCLNNFRFQLLQNVMLTDEITHLIRYKWVKIGPSYLLSEHLSF